LVCPQFRGWTQQDAQEFIRCFLDLIHRELRVAVTVGGSRQGMVVGLLQEETMEGAHDGEEQNSVSSSDSDRGSTENFETADSGWSSDTVSDCRLDALYE
jgi:ubiquitin carboxyl-terminal hydrolase 20/33